MIIFLYGPDDYRREEKKRSIREEFLKKQSNFSIGKFDFAEPETFKEFKNFLASQSIFETKKIAFIENVFESDDREEIAKELKNLLQNKTTTVVLSEKGKPLKAFSFLLQKPVLAQEFQVLEGKEWEKFIANIARKYGVTIDTLALAFLARTYAKNSWGLVTEIEKLSFLGKAITQKDLAGTALEPLPDFWIAINSLRSTDVRKRLSMLEKFFAANEPAAKIFNMLSSIWKDRVQEFADYDLKIKSGKFDYEEALVDAVLR